MSSFVDINFIKKTFNDSITTCNYLKHIDDIILLLRLFI